RTPEHRPSGRIYCDQLAVAGGPPVVSAHDSAQIEDVASGCGDDLVRRLADRNRAGHLERRRVDDRHVAAVRVLDEDECLLLSPKGGRPPGDSEHSTHRDYGDPVRPEGFPHEGSPHYGIAVRGRCRSWKESTPRYSPPDAASNSIMLVA